MNNKPIWSLSNQGSCIIIGSGLLFFKDKKPQGINYETLLKMIQAKPNDELYVHTVKRRLTLNCMYI
jgi:hypothetical protein